MSPINKDVVAQRLQVLREIQVADNQPLRTRFALSKYNQHARELKQDHVIPDFLESANPATILAEEIRYWKWLYDSQAAMAIPDSVLDLTFTFTLPTRIFWLKQRRNALLVSQKLFENESTIDSNWYTQMIKLMNDDLQALNVLT